MRGMLVLTTKFLERSRNIFQEKVEGQFSRALDYHFLRTLSTELALEGG